MQLLKLIASLSKYFFFNYCFKTNNSFFIIKILVFLKNITLKNPIYFENYQNQIF